MPCAHPQNGSGPFPHRVCTKGFHFALPSLPKRKPQSAREWAEAQPGGTGPPTRLVALVHLLGMWALEFTQAPAPWRRSPGAPAAGRKPCARTDARALPPSLPEALGWEDGQRPSGQGLEEMEAPAPPESWEDQTAGPAWEPVWPSSSRDRLANALLYSESGILC